MEPPQVNNDSRPGRYRFDTAHLLADLKAHSVRGGVATLSAQAAQSLISLAATAVLARLLTPGDFGLVAMVQALTGFLAMFGDAGLSTATVQRQEIDQRQVSTLFWLNVCLGIGLMALLAALAPVVVWFYRDARLHQITLALSVSFPLAALAIQHQALLQRQLRFRPLAIIRIVSLALGLAAAIAAAAAGAAYWSLVIGTLTTTTVRSVATWLVSSWTPGRPAWGAGVASMVRFGGERTGFDLLNYGAANLDRLLLGRLWGDRILGLYSRSYHLMMLPIKQINSPMAAVAVPTLSRLQQEPERYRQAYLQMLEKLALVTMPLAVVMIGCADWLIELVLGPQWREAAEIFVYLGLAALLLPIANSSGWLFVSQGRSRDMLRWGFVDAAIKVVSIAAGLPWGAKGVAVAVMARTFLAFPLLWWVTCRIGPVRPRDIYRTLGTPLLAATCALLASLAFRLLGAPLHPAVGTGILTTLALAVSLAVLVSLRSGRRSLRELWDLVALLRRRESA